MHVIARTGVLGVLALAVCRPAGEVEAAKEEAAPVTQAGVAGESGGPLGCEVVKTGMPLPDEVRESSGLAQSRRDADLFWTHNDAGNGAELYALDAEGRLITRVSIAKAQAEDWEDIGSGMCDGSACLYVGDIGDNKGRRQHVTIYRVPEPEKGSRESKPAVALQVRYPDGPQDAEGLFAVGEGQLYVVTKGQHGSIAVYRYPAPHRPNETVTLERVRELFPKPAQDSDRVTGASASPNGRWVAIRTHDHLYLYRASELLAGSGAAEPTVVDLTPLKQPQGEGVAIADDGTVWLSTEAAKKKESSSWARMQCALPGA